ncbi:flagellar biosynthesis protein FlhF [Lysobacter sp. TY2-98]|uniref:AAA family ATPase n=1 Tax=Lysobacter sp. TY2-98 TaxID=2290922 RepID=UPI000E20B05D|nr:AAA family ATPase [Lysobacter sp. TY2-98]AXK71202.1 flagellar biosynthesis protein FlhF [Lysobacter sp. TY2-98]
MRIKRFVAPDMRTALKMVREEHGPDAVILSNKPVHGGIEIVAATDYDEALVQQALRNAAEEPERPATALDALPAFATASLPTRALEAVAAAPAEPKSISRADAMIAALAGNTPQAAATRSALAERARTAMADAEKPAPALSAFLRKSTPAVEAAPLPKPEHVEAPRAGDDFRALLRRLTDEEEATATFSARATEMAQAEAEYVQTRAQAHVEAAASLDDVIEVPVAAVETAAPIDAEIVEIPAPVAATPAPAVEPVAVVTPIIETIATSEPTFAELVTTAPVAVPRQPQNFVDAFDPLAEMAAVQAPAPVVAAAPQRIVTVAAPPTLQLVVNQSEDPTIVAMRNELASMRQMIERQMGQFGLERLRGSPARALAFETLQAYGIDDTLAQTIASRIDPKLEPAKVKAPLLAELARMLTISRSEPLEDGGVFALIGPTGAGKTTTLAKLAARFAQRHRARDVALVTTDVERPGAREQLHALGRKLGITVCEAEGPEGLTDALDQLVDYPLVLVDTAGYAARDKALLGQVTWLRATRNLRSLLVLPANLQQQDMSEAVRRYRMAAPEAVVLTKLDETGRLGGAVSVAIKHGLSLAYTTAGQQVPADLEAADASRLVLQIEKLRRAADNPLATEERHVVA